MTAEQLFNFHEMVSYVASHFQENGFEVKEHFVHEGMKVHVYACKEEEIIVEDKKEKYKDEVIVEVTVSEEIPTLLIGDNLEKKDVKKSEIVGVLTHFQIYFHPTKIYLAIPYYAKNISKIVDLCKWEGIGLLQVNKRKKVEELLPSSDRVELYKEVVNENIGTLLDSENRNEILDKVGDLADSLLFHRAVTTLATPPPSYQMNLSRNLLEKMGNLSNKVIYKEDIKKFCEYYFTKRVDDYNIVVVWVKKLWKKNLALPKIASSFDFYEKFENILKLDREYRDHFLHQFQVFLLGTLILDGIFNKFQEFYKKPFKKLDKNSGFKSWLMASTFHDFAYPLERYSKWNDELFERLLNTKKSPTVIGFEKITIEKNFLEYLDQIDSLLSCYKKCENNWCCKKPHTTNEDLRRFLLNKIVYEKNHGVLSSLALLKKIENETIIDQNTLSTEIYPAAVAIAIHDEGIWQPFRGKKPSWKNKSDKWEEEFSKSNYLNHLDFSNQPLSFLLVFCDTAQEFGRPKFPYSKDEFSQKAQFEDMNVDKDKVRIILSVPTTETFNKKQKELNEVIDFLKSSSIEFIFRLVDKEAGTHRDFPVTS